MGNQIKQIIENFSKNEGEKIKIRSEKKSKTKRKIKQISDKSKQSGGGIGIRANNSRIVYVALQCEFESHPDYYVFSLQL